MTKWYTKSYAAGHLTLPSEYGYSNAGVAAYNIMCDGSESRLADCEINKFPDFTSIFLCHEAASNAAGVVCTYTRMTIV